jgi:hypothetical protein
MRFDELQAAIRSGSDLICIEEDPEGNARVGGAFASMGAVEERYSASDPDAMHLVPKVLTVSARRRVE